MISASELKSGMVIKIGNDLFKAIDAQFKAGTAKMAGATHAKLKNLSTGHIIDRRFHPDEKLEDIEPEKEAMEFLYRDGDDFYFMNPVNFEQVSIHLRVIGNVEKFIKEGMKIPVEFYEGKAVSIQFPGRVELKVTSSPPGIRQTDVTTMKEVTLENGMKILAPQFIKEGEIIVVDVETRKYLSKAKSKEEKEK